MARSRSHTGALDQVSGALQEYASLAIDNDLPAAAPDTQGVLSVAFGGLVERQSRFVFRIAYGMLRNREDAEDVVQETFMKLYRTGSWRGIREERGFLATTAGRIALDRLARRGSALSGNAAVSERDLGELPSPGSNPEEAAVAADWHQAIHRLIDALPEELRQPLALSSSGELNSPEIAVILGVSEGTVRTRLMRARLILKQKLTAIVEVRHGR